ncbi:FCD domain-containing protein [Streptomyces sp. NBC_00879]|uniref:FadR/GntR family transcriptional regulator n=1 Tax=Streptomyces sp. NBC_00879 TaxID=2975855 RepID=UPI00386556DD|nr:FCD domain-containing protein [Streptomyces sp. NBC_00879]
MDESLKQDGRIDWAGGAIFRPVRSGNAFEETLERITQAIKLGVFTYGDRLPVERELAARLNVSRVTLREAMRTLQHSGCVESRRGRYGGSFVTYRVQEPASDDLRRVAERMGEDLEDALTFRVALETGAAERTAKRRLTGEQRAYLQQRLTETEAAAPERYRQADSRFHLAIAELTGSDSLAAGVAETRMRLNDLLNALPIERSIAHSNAQHQAIVQAILTGDPDGARRAMDDHLSATESLLKGLLP